MGGTRSSKRVATAKIAKDDVAGSTDSARSRSRSTSRAAPTVDSHAVHYEFGGPLGAAAIIFGLPLVIFLLYFTCNKKLVMTSPLTFPYGKMLASIPTSFSEWFTEDAIKLYLGWMLLQLFLERVLPGEAAEGVPIEADKGKRLKYTLSGHLQFWISILLMGHSLPLWQEGPRGVWSLKGLGRVPLELVYDHYLSLAAVSIAGATLLSIYLYASSFKRGAVLAAGGNTGSAIYDFFIGRELNPRIGSLDLKCACELRPGLTGWTVINLGMACKQYMNRKAIKTAVTAAGTGGGSVSMSMLLVVLFQGLYVWDAVYQEKAILTTMDITTDGFGFMLAFGDLAWVPFIYSLQARYLVDHDPQLTPWTIAAISALHFVGFYIFRAANSQKDAFRRDPDAPAVRHLKYIETRRGTRLLISGWWGLARKINYSGDWLVTLSWCLLCGFKSPVPYFQALYFAILLIHRAVRDDIECEKKYGEDWKTYKKMVPYMFIPGVF